MPADEYPATLTTCSGARDAAPPAQRVPGQPVERAAQTATQAAQAGEQDRLVSHHEATFSPTGGATDRVVHSESKVAPRVRLPTTTAAVGPESKARPKLWHDEKRAYAPLPQTDSRPDPPQSQHTPIPPEQKHKVTPRRYSRTSTTPSSRTASPAPPPTIDRQAIAEWRLDVYEADAGAPDEDIGSGPSAS